MTPRQIDRAVNAALSRILPPMVRALRDDLRATLHEALAARDDAPAATIPLPTEDLEDLVGALREKVAAEAPAGAAPTPEPTAAEASNPAWFKGEGKRRRMTEEGLLQLRAMVGKGFSAGRIAQRLGMTHSSVQRQMKLLAGTPKEGSAPGQNGVNHKKPDPATPEAKTVAVVPAAEVQAPRQPAATSIPRAQIGAMVAARLPRDVDTGRTIPTQAAPTDPAQLEPVPASYEDALDWLFAHLVREKMKPAEVETRLAALTTKQLLATCNAQRVKAGLSPYVLTERAA